MFYRQDKALLIVGYGNPLLKDDGAGVEAIRRLETSRLPANIDLLDGGNRGIDLIFLMEQYEQIIIIDSIINNSADEHDTKTPGEEKSVLEFSIDKVVEDKEQYISLHNFNVTSVVNLISSLELKIPRILFFGIKAEFIDYGISLTDRVSRDIDFIIDRIKQITNSFIQYRSNNNDFYRRA